MQLGDFLGHADDARGAEGGDDFVHGLVDAVAAFEERERVGEVAVFLQKRDARGALRWEEPDVKKTVAGQPARTEHGGERARAGHRDHRQAAATTRAHHAKTRIAQRGRAGVADDRDGFSGGDEVGEFLRGLGFVVLVISGEVLAQAEPGEQAAGRARVLARHEINATEDRAGAVREVREVADGRGHDIEMAGLRGEGGVFQFRIGEFGLRIGASDAATKKSGAKPDFG